MFRRNLSQADVPVLSGSVLAGVIKALAITAICIAMPVDGLAQCPAFGGVRWAAGASVKYDTSGLPSHYVLAAETAIAQANTFAAAAKTGVKFSTSAPDTNTVTFVINTSGSVGAVAKTSTGGIISEAEIRLNPDATFSGTDKVLDPNAPMYYEALVLVFFHELLHTFGLEN